MSQQAVDAILDRVYGDLNLNAEGTCQCCGKEPMVGVAAVPGVPISIAWGHECLQAGVVPLWVCFAQAGIEEPPEGITVGRDGFALWWLEVHDLTLAYFHVTEEEFWQAINTKEIEDGIGTE